MSDSTFADYMARLRKLPRRTEAQICELYRMMRAGDKCATGQLWEESLRLVLHAARILPGGSAVYDMDMLQEGNLAAAQALKTWDPSRASLSTWIVKYAKGAMVNYHRKEQTRGTGSRAAPPARMISLDASAGIIDEYSESDVPGTEVPDASSTHDVMPSAYEPPESAAARRELWEKVDSIEDSLQRAVLINYFGLYGGTPMTLAEIAPVVMGGVSVTSAHRALTLAIAKMRKKLR